MRQKPLTAKAAANALGVTRSLVYKLIRDGVLRVSAAGTAGRYAITRTSLASTIRRRQRAAIKARYKGRPTTWPAYSPDEVRSM